MDFKSKIPKESNFNPDWIIDLVKKQVEDNNVLIIALENCTHGVWQGQGLVEDGLWNILNERSIGLWKSCGYIQFISSTNANCPGADWQIKKTVMLTFDEHRDIVIDILMDLRVGGIEFLYYDLN